jgi:hypothetical protein
MEFNILVFGWLGLSHLHEAFGTVVSGHWAREGGPLTAAVTPLAHSGVRKHLIAL